MVTSPTRKAKIQSNDSTKCWQDREQQELSYIAARNENGTATLKDRLAVSNKTKHSYHKF